MVHFWTNEEANMKKIAGAKEMGDLPFRTPAGAPQHLTRSLVVPPLLACP